jgi:hypothetical protein
MGIDYCPFANYNRIMSNVIYKTVSEYISIYLILVVRESK